MAYSPPVMVIVAGPLIPVTVIVAEVIKILALALITGAKLNMSGVVSVNNVVAEKVPAIPLIVKTARVAVFGVAEAVTLTITV